MQGEGDRALGPEEVRAGLGSADPAARADALRRARPDPALAPLLATALADPEEAVRVEAVRALARLHGRGAARALMRVAAADPAPAVRCEAVLALGRIAALLLGTEGPTTPSG